MFLRCDLETHNFSVIQAHEVSQASYHSLLSNGDAKLIDELQKYMCHGMKKVGYEFRRLVPQLEHHIRRSLRECAYDEGIFGLQKLRFLVFEYFARFAARDLVAESVMKDRDWYYYVDVYNLEKKVASEWYEWFEETGVFFDRDLGLMAEARLHLQQLRDIVEGLDE